MSAKRPIWNINNCLHFLSYSIQSFWECVRFFVAKSPINECLILLNEANFGQKSVTVTDSYLHQFEMLVCTNSELQLAMCSFTIFACNLHDNISFKCHHRITKLNEPSFCWRYLAISKHKQLFTIEIKDILQ